VAARCVALGLHISIAGPITYPNARRLPEVVRTVPRARLVLETDAPYLPPQPWRGRRNEPAYLAATAERVAELRGLSLPALVAETTRSASELLQMPRPSAA
jgi:TatD DNase family protein